MEQSDIAEALNTLVSNENGDLDLGSLVSNFSANNLGDIVNSWFGTGDNEGISVDQVSELFSTEKIAEFASNLGIDEDSAKDTIAEALPNLIDSVTSGENSIVDMMLDKVGGVDGAMSMLSKIFR